MLYGVGPKLTWFEMPLWTVNVQSTYKVHWIPYSQCRVKEEWVHEWVTSEALLRAVCTNNCRYECTIDLTSKFMGECIIECTGESTGARTPQRGSWMCVRRGDWKGGLRAESLASTGHIEQVFFVKKGSIAFHHPGGFCVSHEILRYSKVHLLYIKYTGST